MKKRFSVFLCLALLLTVLPSTVFAATTIDSADISIAHPVHAANPETFLLVYGNCQTDTTYNSDGFQNGLRWREVASGKTMGASDTFVGGNLYELSVLLISKTGYAFSASATTVTVNGDPVSLTVLDVNRAKATITLTADNLYINYVTVTDLDAPKAGNTPDYSVSVQEDTCNVLSVNQESIYNGVFWFDGTAGEFLTSADRFVAGHVYAAGVYVQAKAGYVFPQNVQAIVTGATRTQVQVSYDPPGLCEVAAEFPALADNHTHTPSAWRTTGAYHYKACTTCGDFLEQEDHKGGVATCSEKGKCTVCGYAYIEENETHNPDTEKWTACGDLYHAHLCKDCGAHAVTEDHKPGPDATETEPQKCTVCGYILTPAKNHTHALTLVPEKAPTCTEPGNSAYYTCDGCTQVFADAEGKTAVTDTVIAPLGHKISDDWKYDENNHWRTCTVCHEVLGETQLVHEMQDGKCATCGYGEENVPQDPKATEATEPTPPPQQPMEEDQGLNWIWLVIAGAVCLAIGIAVPLVVVKRKKKTERTSL